MAEVQKQFEDFHNDIKLEEYDENETLREKRNAVLKKLDSGLKSVFEKKKEPVPAYKKIDLGSYALGTGIKPHDEGDYDIDVGILFEISKADHKDPVKVKEWVLDALTGHTNNVEMRRPCVTVFYQNGDELLYHVDLAIYSAMSDSNIYLAKGKLNSEPAHRFWEDADPRTLIKIISERFSGKDAAQFRRVIRYLKRWKDFKFTGVGKGTPTGIALTICAYTWFSPIRKVDIQGKEKYEDLNATRSLVDSILANFRDAYCDGEIAKRIEMKLPVKPNADLFAGMTNTQMGEFKERLTKLSQALKFAVDSTDPIPACERLQKEFGTDFPVPEKPETGEPRKRAIVNASQSG